MVVETCRRAMNLMVVSCILASVCVPGESKNSKFSVVLVVVDDCSTSGKLLLQRSQKNIPILTWRRIPITLKSNAVLIVEVENVLDLYAHIVVILSDKFVPHHLLGIQKKVMIQYY